MSKVVILAINAKYIHSSLSVWVLSEGVFRYARTAHDVEVVEVTIHHNDSDIAGLVEAHNPDVIGISTYIWNARKLPDLLNLLRERLPKAAFVLGGPEAAHNAQYWLDNGADFVLRGEGERSFPALIDMLADKRSPEPIPGLCQKQNGEIHITPEAGPIGDFIDPYSDAYFAGLGGRIAYIETSRGCPFSCAFCLSGGTGVRFMPLEAAKEQIRRLADSGARMIKFVDRTFNCNAQRAYELFEYIIGLDTKGCFHFEVAADLFDQPTLALLAAAPPGRIQFEAGLQSFYEPALKASSRQTDLEKAEENIRALLKAGNIHIHLDLIAGLPYEMLTDFMDSFDRAYRLGMHTLQLGFLKLLYGSVMREQWKSIVCAPQPPYEIISSLWLSPDDLNVIKHAENALQRTYNKGRFLSALRYALFASGLRPFSFYHALGQAAPNHGTQLEDYIGQLYTHCVKLPGVETDALLDHMTIDWLGMVKGKNMPTFLRAVKENDRLLRQVTAMAEDLLGRRIRRGEASVLRSGEGVFVDSEKRDPVSGLYQVHILEHLA